MTRYVKVVSIIWIKKRAVTEYIGTTLQRDDQLQLGKDFALREKNP